MKNVPILALDIGGTKIAGAVLVARREGAASEPAYPQVACEASTPTNAAEGGSAVLARVVRFAQDLAARYAGEDHASPLAGIAVASAGVIDEANGNVISATDIMPGWGGQPLGASLSASFGVPAAVLNDVHAHALGEAHFGAGRDAHSMAAFGVGTGIGGALVLDGRVLHGKHNVAGHLGHLPHPLADELLCSCGRYGHIESVASGSGIARLYNQRLENAATPAEPELAPVSGGRQLQERAEAGEALALATFADSARALGNVMAGIANAYDPEVFVLSGSMTKSGSLWWDHVREGYREQAMNPVAYTPIVQGELGGRAPLFGAAYHFLAREQLL